MEGKKKVKYNWKGDFVCVCVCVCFIEGGVRGGGVVMSFQNVTAELMAILKGEKGHR